MSVFTLCSEKDCDLLAKYSCHCHYFCCDEHRHTHSVSHGGHIPLPILLSLSEEEATALHAINKRDFQFLIRQELANRDKALDKLLREMRQVEELYSVKLKHLLKSQEEILSVFKEVREKRAVPLVSENTLVISLVRLKQQKNLNPNCVQRIVKQKLDDFENLQVPDLENEHQLFEEPILQRSIQQNSGKIWGIDIGVLGKIIATANECKMVKLWDLETGSLIRNLIGHSGWVRSVRFSPSNRLLASGSHDQTVKIWDAETGECLKTLRGHSGLVMYSIFSPDNSLVASACTCLLYTSDAADE